MIRENFSACKDLDILNSNGTSKCYCDSNNLDYYHEIEKYKSKLKDSHNYNNRLELEISDIKERYKKEVIKLNEEVSKQREKYERLHESHKRISRLNHDLEERILNLIEKFNNDKLEVDESYKDILSKYESSQTFILELQNESDRYRNDCIIAVQLLQNNPSSFLSRHFETLPQYLKNRLNQLHKEIDIRHSFDQRHNNYSSNRSFHNKNVSNSSYIPITTFPPTAMHFSDYCADKSHGPPPYDNRICASVLAEVLHPDKTGKHGTHKPETKCTIELVCSQCGSVKEYRSVCVQTIPNYLVDNINSISNQQPPIRNNQNIIFDV